MTAKLPEDGSVLESERSAYAALAFASFISGVPGQTGYSWDPINCRFVEVVYRHPPGKWVPIESVAREQESFGQVLSREFPFTSE